MEIFSSVTMRADKPCENWFSNLSFTHKCNSNLTRHILYSCYNATVRRKSNWLCSYKVSLFIKIKQSPHKYNNSKWDSNSLFFIILSRPSISKFKFGKLYSKKVFLILAFIMRMIYKQNVNESVRWKHFNFSSIFPLTACDFSSSTFSNFFPKTQFFVSELVIFLLAFFVKDTLFFPPFNFLYKFRKFYKMAQETLL